MPEQTRDLSIGEALDFGVQLAMAGNHDSAIGLFKGVLMHEPENFEAIERLGSSLFELKRYHEALYWFWRGRKLERRNPMALTNYGLCVAQLGHWDEGLADIERAIYHANNAPNGSQMSREGMALLYNNLGNTLERLGRYPEALTALNKGIACNRNDAFPHYNRGIVLLRLNRQREAIAAFDTSLAIDPRNADAHYNRGMGHLLLGDFDRGFADYEYRLLTSENEQPNLGLPAGLKWSGAEPIEGKTILVHCEQGLGDDIQFLRFLPLLAEKRPAQILLITHAATAPLAADATGGVPLTVLKSGAPLPEYDHWAALMSLPWLLGIEHEEQLPEPFRPSVGFDRLQAWHEKLALPSQRLNVGVCWAGNWRHKNDAHRSIPLEQFATIFDTDGCNFISLQQMRPGELDTFRALKERHPDNLKAYLFEDFRDTAAAILNLDVVVTVDTAIAHLAASLGKTTLILIPAFGTDWRWQLERSDSPWYRSARLIRQAKVGDWSGTLDVLRQELIAMAPPGRMKAACG